MLLHHLFPSSSSASFVGVELLDVVGVLDSVSAVSGSDAVECSSDSVVLSVMAMVGSSRASVDVKHDKYDDFGV